MLCTSCPFRADCSNHGGSAPVDDLFCAEEREVQEGQAPHADREDEAYYKDIAEFFGYCGSVGCSICSRFDDDDVYDDVYDDYDDDVYDDDLYYWFDDLAGQDHDRAHDIAHDPRHVEPLDFTPSLICPRRARSWSDTTRAEKRAFNKAERQGTRLAIRRLYGV